nr:SDR family NAD(P)-dependent oxidoreductase [Dyadobacter sp. NIV53]
MQTIFITGASSGLGKTTARLFQANGWKVIATMRNPEKETELGLLENVTLLPMDVTNPDQVTQTVQKAVTLGVDVVLNNAGYGLVGGFEAYTDQQIRKQLETNLLGVLRVSQPFITYFREQKKGGYSLPSLLLPALQQIRWLLFTAPQNLHWKVGARR